MRPSILTGVLVAALLPALPLSAAAAQATEPAAPPPPPATATARAKPKKKAKKKPAARRRAPARRRASAPPQARLPRDTPRRGARYSISGTITVNATIRTRCAGLGNKGEITETATTFSEYRFSGSGVPGGKGTPTTRLRRRVVLDKQVVDVEYTRPSHIEGDWSSGSTSSADFGDVVFLSRGQLVGDLDAAIGERRRVTTLRPAPQATADLRFGGKPVRREFEPGVGCFESYEETLVTGTLTVTDQSDR